MLHAYALRLLRELKGENTYMKKIAIVADGWRRYINYAWISGCRQYIKEKKLDAQLYVFYAFGNFSKDEKYNQGEYNIITLPDFRQFDGIIVEITNVLKRKCQNKTRCFSRASSE